METIPGVKREKGVRYLIDHDLDLALGVAFLVRECADEPKMKAAKDRQLLARNILTMKGTGAEKELNWRSWRDAIIKYGEDIARSRDGAFKEELAKKDERILELEAEARSLYRDNRDLTQRALMEGAADVPARETVPA